VNKTIRQRLANRKRRIDRRLDKNNLTGCARPIMTATNIHYELADRTQGLVYGGLGAVHALAQKLGLIDALDDRLHLLKFHFPYHESDHVLTLAYNALCDGTCLQDLELHRTDEVFLNALGARRLPDPTTAGDFGRRFERAHIFTLLDVYDEVRLQVWAKQRDRFFDQAIIDMDGTLVETTGACKQGMDIAYDGTWGYHPLVLSLAQTGEVLSLVNRSGNRPSSDGAAAQVDRVLAVCFQGGFRKVLLRGDTDFSQTEHLDRWTDDPRVSFLFGYDATPNLKEEAENLPPQAWKPLTRPPRYQVKTPPRQRPDNIKEAIVVARQFENQRLQAEHVAEFPYRPSACKKTYRMVVVRKNLSVSKGEQLLFDEVRYCFYLTNEAWPEPEEVVPVANDRGNQENLIAQLHSGVRALKAPVNTLESNWAYMVMTALAWNLKAWWALSRPEQPGRWCERHREQKRWLLGLEFKTFVSALVRLPCQLVRTGRKLVYRLLSWNPHQHLLFRLLDVLRC
jgi:hypothetical protein